ncbi:hypothetical protein DSECCO2_619970 [anaerobic digester metagenome]
MGLDAQQFGVFLHPRQFGREAVQFVLAPEAGHHAAHLLVLEDGHDVEDEFAAAHAALLVELGLARVQGVQESRLRDDGVHGPAGEALLRVQAGVAPGRLVADADVPLVVDGDDPLADGLQHGHALQVEVGDFGGFESQGHALQAAGDDHGAQDADHAHADDVHEGLVQMGRDGFVHAFGQVTHGHEADDGPVVATDGSHAAQGASEGAHGLGYVGLALLEGRTGVPSDEGLADALGHGVGVAALMRVADDHEGRPGLGADGLGDCLDFAIRVSVFQGLADARDLGDGLGRLQGGLADLLVQHLFGQPRDDMPADGDLDDDQGQYHQDEVPLDSRRPQPVDTSHPWPHENPSALCGDSSRIAVPLASPDQSRGRGRPQAPAFPAENAKNLRFAPLPVLSVTLMRNSSFLLTKNCIRVSRYQTRNILVEAVMVNMDYPGPCFSCSAIEGCASEEAKKLAVKGYCKGVERELNAWKATLYDVMVGFLDLGDKDRGKLVDAVAEIKALVREIEAKTAQLEAECPLEMAPVEKALGDRMNALRVHYTKAMEVIGAGSFGG